ncbi:oxidoreductase [Roseovarius salis]|uniref:oxidoreductase n=1 Tax=Roseovarius salis TaxID=3376063 RepID=UPI0037C7A5CE
MSQETELFTPLALPNGTYLKNRIVKSAMSDSLGDGRGNPTGTQIRLYERWAQGGAAASIIGEVQGDPRFAEKPGNLVLHDGCDREAFRALARRGGAEDAGIWCQLGHAGALTPPGIGTPKGPSAIDLPELRVAALTLAEIRALPDQFAKTAMQAESLGFSGVQVHAAHGFLLSQFLSPLFNRRTDAYGGDIGNRMKLLLEVVEAVRGSVSTSFVVALKLNSSDQLEGGLEPSEALAVIEALDRRGLDLIDISGGTYFPGAPSSSDRASTGPYFLDFAAGARRATGTPLMATGGFKRREDAEAALSSGVVDVVGLARALVLDPDLPRHWQAAGPDPTFPRFEAAPAGGVTAWFTMRLNDLGEDREGQAELDASAALEAYDARDRQRVPLWNDAFREKP